MLTRSPSQWCASFLLLVAAGTHIPLIQDHLEEAPYVGWLFIALSVVCLALAGVILFVDRAGVWLLSAAVCFAAAVAFLASRTIGLPQIGDDVGNWSDPLGPPAVASEMLVVVLAWLHLRHATRQPTFQCSGHPVERVHRTGEGSVTRQGQE